MRVLRARLYELEREKQEPSSRERGARRSARGERAEKIRTYNFPENRLTDHRIKLTVHQLDRILEGELDEFTEALDDGGPRGARARLRRRDRRADGARRRRRASGSRGARGRVAAARRGAAARARARARALERLAARAAPTSVDELDALRGRSSSGAAPRAARLRARRVGLPAADAETDAARARAAARDGGRRRALPRAARAGSSGRAVLDVGTGSGAIALAIADEQPGRARDRVDISARRSRSRPRTPRRPASPVELRAARPRDGLRGPWDLVVSNPPYVAAGELDGLAARGPRLGAARGARRRGAARADRRGARRRAARASRSARPRSQRRRGGARRACSRSSAATTSAPPDLAGRDRVVEGWPESSDDGRGAPGGRARGAPDRHRLRALRAARPRGAVPGSPAQGPDRSKPIALLAADVDALVRAALPELRPAALGGHPARARSRSSSEPGAALPLADGSAGHDRRPRAAGRAGRACSSGRGRRRDEREPPRRARPAAARRRAGGDPRGLRRVVDGGELPGHAVDRDRPHRREPRVLREGAGDVGRGARPAAHRARSRAFACPEYASRPGRATAAGMAVAQATIST